MYDLYGQNFINAIRSLINARPASGNKELVTRCPFCGDSKNPSHAHFYISVPQNDMEISFYNCKKCPAAGILSDDILRKLNINDSSLLIAINKHNSEVLKTPRYNTIKNTDIYNLKNTCIREDKNNEYKLNYINNRIGSNFSYEDILSLKIFLNLYDVLNQNNLDLTRYKNITDQLDIFFIGFISYDNSFANMRKVTDKELYKSVNKRYINYNLTGKIDNNKNYYIIPTSIDLTSNDPIRIHIAEGPFDILSIYYNLNNCNRFNNIYISCGGKGYYNALSFILQEIGMINFELHYYPDRDIDDYFINKLINAVGMLPTDIYIHRNSFGNEKDYGVPKDRIKDNIFKVENYG